MNEEKETVEDVKVEETGEVVTQDNENKDEEKLKGHILKQNIMHWIRN